MDDMTRHALEASIHRYLTYYVADCGRAWRGVALGCYGQIQGLCVSLVLDDGWNGWTG